VNGVLPLLADLLVRSTALILFAWAAATLLRKGGASAAMRHLVWSWAIAGLALLPILALTMPALPLTILPQVVIEPILTAPAVGGAVATTTKSAPSLIPVILLSSYMPVAAAMLAWLLMGQRALAQIWRASAPADATWTDLLDKVAGDLRLRDRVALRLARTTVMPMTWGTRAPKVLLPAEAREWTLARRRLVLLHELGHVRRRDSLTQMAAAIVRAFYWFHPGAWLAARQLRLEQELAADDLALSAGAQPNRYARNLLEIACAFCLPAPAMARRSQLEQRISAIMLPTCRQAPGFSFNAIAATLVLSATWLSATATPVASAVPAVPALEIATNEAASTVRVLPAEEFTAPVAQADPENTPPSISLAVRAPPAKAILVQATASDNPDPAAEHDHDMVRYRHERADYEVALVKYRSEREVYGQELDQYRRELAEYRQEMEAIRALPHDDPRRIFPPAPVAPVAPIAPPVPVLPPQSPDLDRS
jgi:beta-lactamase regulating signal transducer with metallopeptidase domain